MDDIEYLYHYTNIETLALILKNRTIRFNSLDKMDDLQEEQTADIKNIGQFCYISSWTDDATESIPMWNMYASLNLGVRIRLRKDPFKVYDNNIESFAKVVDIPVVDDSNGAPFPTLIPLSEMFTNGFVSIQALNRRLLCKVEYTNDAERLYPHILKDDGERFSIALGELGKSKNLHWKFQNEWRYILDIIPFNMNQPIEKIMSDFQILAHEMKLGLATQSVSYYDMRISDEAFEDMQVTLSPRISTGSKIIVEDLIEKYNPSAELKQSTLVGLI